MTDDARTFQDIELAIWQAIHGQPVKPVSCALSTVLLSVLQSASGGANLKIAMDADRLALALIDDLREMVDPDTAEDDEEDAETFQPEWHDPIEQFEADGVERARETMWPPAPRVVRFGGRKSD